MVQRRGRVVGAALLWCSAVVEWLERLCYGAESRLKTVSSRLGFLTGRLENSFCQPSFKWVHFSNCGRLRQRKERDGFHLSSPVPKIQWGSNTHNHCLRLLGDSISILFYPITLEGRRGTTDEFATIYFWFSSSWCV